MIELRFKDIDPDTGEVSQDLSIAVITDQSIADWIIAALEAYDDGNCPNREYYSTSISEETIVNRPLTVQERVAWIVCNYYETGMDVASLSKLSDLELDNFTLYGKRLNVPKTMFELRNISVN